VIAHYDDFDFDFFVKTNKTNKINILKKIKFEKMTKKDF
jgi:hypothetical protein